MPLHPTSAARACGRCLRRPPAYDRTCAAAAYAAPFEQLVRGLKYGATLAYAPLLGELLHAQARRLLGDEVEAIDLLLPVPLSRERMASRGFNQAIEIGRVLARRWHRPLDTQSVLRIHDTAPQAGLRLAARRRNLRHAFAVIDRQRARLAGLRIGVVDDVMTSGATLDELARTLKLAGVAHVVNLVVARALLSSTMPDASQSMRCGARPSPIAHHRHVQRRPRLARDFRPTPATSSACAPTAVPRSI